MAKQGGMGDRAFVDEFNLSGDVQSLGRIGGGPIPSDVTAIDKSAPERIGLLFDGGIDFVTFFNDDNTVGAQGALQVLKTLPQTDRQITYCRGAAIGSPAASCISKQIGYDPTRGQDGTLTLAVSSAANGFGLQWGEQLTAGVRTDTVATAGASIDLGAVSTLFGASAYLHVFSVTGTSMQVQIEDSADNVTFATIAGMAFTSVLGGATSKQRINTTATNTTVRRYVRATTFGTFSNARFAVNFVRYLTAQPV